PDPEAGAPRAGARDAPPRRSVRRDGPSARPSPRLATGRRRARPDRGAQPPVTDRGPPGDEVDVGGRPDCLAVGAVARPRPARRARTDRRWGITGTACHNPERARRPDRLERATTPRPARPADPRSDTGATLHMTVETSTWATKKGLAQMLKGGVIMDVVTPDQAKIAED